MTSNIYINIKQLLPVRCQRRESEHWHTDRSQLNKGDEFTTHPPKEPLIRQKLTGIHGRAGDQQQQVSESETRHEEIGNIAHGFHDAKCSNECHVTNQSNNYNERVNGGDNNTCTQVWIVGSAASVALQRFTQRRKLYIRCRSESCVKRHVTKSACVHF